MTTLLARLAALLALIAGAALARAQSEPSAASFEVDIEALDGATRHAQLGAARVAQLAELGALVRFRGGAATARPRAAASELELAGGDRLFGQLLGGDAEHLAWKLPGDSLVSIPLELVRVLRVHERLLPEQVGSLAPAPEQDRLYRRIGDSLDRIDGTLLATREQGLEFDSRVGRRTYAWEELAALFLTALDEPAARAPAGALEPVTVDLVGGGRLHAQWVAWSEGALRLQRAGWGEFSLPGASLLQIARDDGALAFVSDLEPLAEQPARPFGDDLGMVWAHRMDACATGGALRAGGQLHPRGIGMHAPARLSFALAGGWRELRGAAAIDDSALETLAHGSALLRIELDGREIWRSALLRAGQPIAPIPALSVAGAKTLELIVESAEDGFAGDRADWLGLRLLR